MGDKTSKNKGRIKPLYIGLTGRMASGKGEAVKILEERGFTYISLSDMVREEARRTGRENITREEMQDIGNRLRKEGGAGILGRRVKDKIAASGVKKWVIDGIRNPAEIRQLKELAPFYLIGLESDTATILERLRARARDTDRLEESELIRRLKREWGEGEPGRGHQVGLCMELADYKIENDDTLEKLKSKIYKILSLIEENNAG